MGQEMEHISQQQKRKRKKDKKEKSPLPLDVLAVEIVKLSSMWSWGELKVSRIIQGQD